MIPAGYFLFGFHGELAGREPEVRASKEPSENADLFAIFWGDAVKQGFSLEKLLPSKAHQILYNSAFRPLLKSSSDPYYPYNYLR